MTACASCTHFTIKNMVPSFAVELKLGGPAIAGIPTPCCQAQLTDPVTGMLIPGPLPASDARQKYCGVGAPRFYQSKNQFGTAPRI